MAALIRLRDSLTEASGKPTISIPGRPSLILASIVIGVPVIPTKAIDMERPTVFLCGVRAAINWDIRFSYG